MVSLRKTGKKPLPKTADAVIIGGGIIGVSIAYYLAKNGVQNVVLLEKGMMGEGSTGKCAGGMRIQFSTRINIQISLLSRNVLEGFLTEFGVDPEFCPIGYLFLARRPEQWSILKSNAQLIQSMGCEVALLDCEEIQGRWPFLYVNDLSGGSYSASDGYAGPYEVLQGFIKGARRMGVSFIEGTKVTGIHTHRGIVKAVETAKGDKIVTSMVVNAAGPYAAKVAAMVGLDLPVIPLRRQIFFTDSYEPLPPQFPMIIDMDNGWYMRREGKGLLLAGQQDEKSSFFEEVDFEGRAWSAERALYRVPILENARISSGWAGLYEISPDNHAIIGSFPKMEGFICANGFSGHGFMHGPATGILVLELIVYGEAKSLNIHPLRPSRFQEGDLIHEPLTAFRNPGN